MADYCVSAGEHLSQIAEENGFGSIDTITAAPENAELFAARPDPHQLAPGDVLTLPEKTTQAVSLPVDASHRLTVKRQQLLLRLKILDYTGEPVAGESGTLVAGDAKLDVTTDADGLLEATVPRTTRTAELELAGVKYELEVGGLLPSSSVDGVRARLNNMGYWTGVVGDDDSGEETEFRLGIELFQDENDLTVDGVLSDECKAKVVEVHGQ